jgi:hypothetical protein
MKVRWPVVLAVAVVVALGVAILGRSKQRATELLAVSARPSGGRPPARERPVRALAVLPRGAGNGGPAPASTRPRGTVRGRLVDLATGDGVPEAIVTCATGGARSTVTDAGGTFLLSDLPIGRSLRVAVETRGQYLPEVIDLLIPDGVTTADAGTTRLLRGSWDERFRMAGQGVTGINSELRDGKVVVSKVRPGTPAERAGIRVGERLLAIDGQAVEGLGHRARSYLLQGPPGTTVTVALEDSAGARRTATLTRAPGAGPPQWPFTDRRPQPRRR